MSTERRPADDSGFSLIELLVAMGVLSVVMIIVTNLFITVSATTNAANTARSAVGQANNAQDEITRVIRMATSNVVAGSNTASPAVIAGSASTLTVLSYVDTAASAPLPTKVSFSVSAGTLQETRTPYVASGVYAVQPSPAVSTTRAVATGLTSIAFAYADAKGISVDAASCSLTGAANAALCASITSITVTVTAANTSGKVNDPIVLTNAVLLTNVALANGNS